MELRRETSECGQLKFKGKNSRKETDAEMEGRPEIEQEGQSGEESSSFWQILCNLWLNINLCMRRLKLYEAGRKSSRQNNSHNSHKIHKTWCQIESSRRCCLSNWAKLALE